MASCGLSLIMIPMLSLFEGMALSSLISKIHWIFGVPDFLRSFICFKCTPILFRYSLVDSGLFLSS